MASFRGRRRPSPLLLVVGLALSWQAVARADKNDLNLLNLCLTPDGANHCAGGSDTNAQSRYRSLMSELGVVVAPRLMTPADTLGYAGFQFSGELGITTINNNRKVSDDPTGIAYWNGIEGVNAEQSERRPAELVPHHGRWFRPQGTLVPAAGFRVRRRRDRRPRIAHVRDAGLRQDCPPGRVSRLGAAVVRGARFGLAAARHQPGQHDRLGRRRADLEGVQHRGNGADRAVLRVERPLHQRPQRRHRRHAQLRRLRPARSARGHRRPPPGCDPANNGTWNDLDNNFTFPSQDVITRYRWSVGAKLKLSVLFLTVEGDLIQGGTSHDSNADVVDNSATQESFSLSAGLDF